MKRLLAGDEIVMNIPLMSGWIGRGIVCKNQDDGDDVVEFYKLDDDKWAMALRSEMSVIGAQALPFGDSKH